MLHVGMNIADKATLFAQVKRALRPGGTFGVYDVMRIGPGDLAYPVPWALTPATSFVAADADYRAALRDAGFAVQKERERRAFAIEFFKKMQARVAESGPPPLGLNIAMGADFPHKVRNLLANLENGLLAPIEMICPRNLTLHRCRAPSCNGVLRTARRQQVVTFTPPTDIGLLHSHR